MTHRVLVTRLDGAGDVLLAGPAVRAIAAARDTEVTLLCGPAGAAAARLLPGVADVVVWASPWVVNPAPPIDRAALDRFVDGLAARGVAEAVILTSFHQSPLPTALLLRLAGVGRITGASIDYPGTLLDVRLRPGDGPGDDLPEDLPEPERALAIAAAAGYRLPDGDPGGLAVLPPPPLGDLLAPLAGRPYVVVHPGAAVGARRWPAGHHRRAAGLLADDGLAVVVTGGPDERDLTAEVAAGAPGAVDLGGRTGLPELSAVLAGAAAVVVGNTGAAHLAAAVGTPVVSLFAPVVPAVRWRPYGVRQVLLGDQDAPCRDTRARDCPVPGHPCLARVEPDDVRDAVRRLRAAPPARGRPARRARHRSPRRKEPRDPGTPAETADSAVTIGPSTPVPAPASRATRGVGTVLVTGAASGLGRAVAAAVTAAGGRALLVDRVPVDCQEGDAGSPEGSLAAVADLADTARRRGRDPRADRAGRRGGRRGDRGGHGPVRCPGRRPRRGVGARRGRQPVRHRRGHPRRAARAEAEPAERSSPSPRRWACGPCPTPAPTAPRSSGSSG